MYFAALQINANYNHSFQMNNKFPIRQSRSRTRRQENYVPFSLQLTNSQELNNSLLYSNTDNKLIQLNKISKLGEELPKTTEFATEKENNKQYRRKDCIDRKFQGIKKLHKSTPNVKIVSPKKVDIILTEQSHSSERKKREPIHSVRFFSKRISPERDLLKEFRLLQEMRKQLRSRNFQNSSRESSRTSFRLSAGHADKTSEPQQIQNPERSGRNSSMYLQVKARISRRYNSMFRKFSQREKEEMRSQHLLFKDICSARSYRIDKPCVIGEINNY